MRLFSVTSNQKMFVHCIAPIDPAVSALSYSLGLQQTAAVNIISTTISTSSLRPSYVHNKAYVNDYWLVNM